MVASSEVDIVLVMQHNKNIKANIEVHIKSIIKGGKKDGIIKSFKKGFTLLEVLMVIGILAILAAIVLVAINPARQFKIARDSQRNANISTVLNAIGQNLTDHGGVFTCEGVIKSIPTTRSPMSVGEFDIASCLVPDYVSILPFDPSKEDAHYVNETNYDTGYYIRADEEGRVTVSADGELASTTLSVTR